MGSTEGQIISHCAQLTRTQKEEKLTEQISELDQQHAMSPTSELLAKRISVQTEFNLLSTSETTTLTIIPDINIMNMGRKYLIFGSSDKSI